MPTMATYKGVLSSRVGLLRVLSRSFSYSLYGHMFFFCYGSRQTKVTADVCPNRYD